MKKLSFKVDFSKDFVWQNNNGQFKFGFKHQSREKFNDADVTIYDGGFDDIMAQQFATATPNYNIGNFGPGISQSSLKDYVLTNRADFDVDQLKSTIDSKGNSFESNEDVSAAYAMGNA